MKRVIRVFASLPNIQISPAVQHQQGRGSDVLESNLVFLGAGPYLAGQPCTGAQQDEGALPPRGESSELCKIPTSINN